MKSPNLLIMTIPPTNPETNTAASQPLRRCLASMGRYLRLRDGLRLAAQTVWLAVLAALLVELAARFWPMPDRHLWALLPVGLWLATVALFSLLRPVPLYRVARRLDAELGLKDRLATALELQESAAADPLAFKPRQLADAENVAEQLGPGKLNWQVSHRKLGWAAGLLALLLAVAVLPNPMDDILRQRAAIQETVAEQAEAIRAARDELEAETDPTSEERAQALRELERLMNALAANPGDLEQALADLTQAQAELRALQSPTTGADRSALDQLAGQLTALSRGEAQAATEAAEAGQALNELASALPSLDAAAQAELADSLEALAAQAAATDAELAETLVELANAVRDGNIGEALQAAGAAQGALAQADQNADLQAALAQAQTALNESRQQLAQTGQGQAQAQGQGQNQGQGQGQGQPGSGGGTTADQLPGANRSGQAGDPTQPNRTAGMGTLDSIYAPESGLHLGGNPDFVAGQETDQGQTIVREEQSPQGNVNPALVPYRDVYQNYADAAAETMEREQIPAEWQGYVRDYFSELEPE